MLTLQGEEAGRAFALTGSILLKGSRTGPTWRGPRSLRLSPAIHSGQGMARELARPGHVWQGHCLKPVPGSDSPSGHLGSSAGSEPRVCCSWGTKPVPSVPKHRFLLLGSPLFPVCL